MWSRLALCTLIVVFIDASLLDDCPDGRLSLGNCLAGLCPVGAECVKSTCCKNLDGEGTTEAPVDETTVIIEDTYRPTSEEDDEDRATCKDASKAIGECLGDFCPSGYQCEGGNCCPPPVTEPPTTTRPSRLTSATAMSTETTTQHTVTEPETEETPEGICLVDKPIGECVDGRCPHNNECVEGNWCCPVTPQINCTDVLKECKTHLCNRKGYVDFMTANCGRSCKRCDQQSTTAKPESEKIAKKKKTKKCKNSRTDCDEWASEGFCNSTLYSDDQKRQICGISCKLC